MMTTNSRILITASPELSAMRLDDLAGRQGLVVEVLEEGRVSNIGCIVLLDVPYLDEFLWFIPRTSVTYG